MEAAHTQKKRKKASFIEEDLFFLHVSFFFDNDSSTFTQQILFIAFPYEQIRAKK